MSSSITPEELTALSRDPAQLMAEIQRYTQIRDDAESKLRAVVDEVTANELKVLAERELHNARITVEDANKQAGEILGAARTEAARITESSDADAKAVLDNSTAHALAVRAEADEILQRAKVTQTSLEERTSAADRSKESAEKAIAANNEAAAEYREATAQIDSSRQRLSALVKEMAEIVRV